MEQREKMGEAPEILDADVDALIQILDGYNASEGNRLHIDVVDTAQESGVVDRKYHLGRCDICSPFATGQAFDVLPTEEQ